LSYIHTNVFLQQVALLLPMDRATRYVSKFVLCFTRRGS